MGALESAVAQPLHTFGGQDLYRTVVEKAAALCFSVVSNHPFVDGNKRVGHAALETMVILNGQELSADEDDAEAVMLNLAAGALSRDEFVDWVRRHTKPVA